MNWPLPHKALNMCWFFFADPCIRGSMIRWKYNIPPSLTPFFMDSLSQFTISHNTSKSERLVSSKPGVSSKYTFVSSL